MFYLEATHYFTRIELNRQTKVLNPNSKTAVPKKSAKSPPKKTVQSVSKMERIRSMVNMSNGHSKLKASPSVAATPTRRSSRRATVASTAATNG